MSDSNNWRPEESIPNANHWVEYDLSDPGPGEAEVPSNPAAERPRAPSSPKPRTASTPAAADNPEATRRLTRQNRPGKGEMAMRASRLDGESDPEEGLEPRDYRPIRFRRDGKLGCLGGLMYAVFIISISVILACLGWMAASDVLALNKEPRTATVELPKSIFSDREVETEKDGEKFTETLPSADIGFVSKALEDAGIIEYPILFKLYAKFSNADVKIDPGTYELSSSFDYRALVKKMQAGSNSQLQTFLTFPEGYTMRQIFAKLEEAEICSAESLYDAAANGSFSYSFLNSVTATGSERLEGFLFPDSYYFYQGMSANSAINKFLSNMHYLITADMLAQAESLSLSWNQVIIIASLIERETSGSPEDRASISCVIHNRLAANMPLQIDAAVLYDHPEHTGAPTAEMISEDSPHNTHTKPGLPPTAIANPGLDSIRAALNPNGAKYYYYALDEATGEHRFFTNYSEHAAFVATQSYGR